MTAQERLSQIRDLVNQWEQLVGFSIVVGDDIVNMLADGNVQSLYDLGQWMNFHGQAEALHTYPWARWGMTSLQYNQKVESFASTFRALTGQNPEMVLVEQALSELGGTMTGAQFDTWLLAQDSIKQQYGWLRYGLDFQQFQTQKLQMRTGFGRDLTNEEAVAQLQYHHAAQGRDLSVVARPQSQQQQKGTAGVSGSVVR